MSFSKADRAAYGMGLRCAQAGTPTSANPYTASSGLGQSWLAGHAKGRTTPRRRHTYTTPAADAFDMAYEDQCAAACGVGL